MLGCVADLNIQLLVMNGLNKTEFFIFISLMWSLLPKDQTYFLSVKEVFFFVQNLPLKWQKNSVSSSIVILKCYVGIANSA